jgi:hypothetical protein
MKIALVFLVLLALLLLGLPFSAEGDRSLTGRVQSFLSYTLSATGLLLGVLTLFLSRSLSDELVNRSIFITLTKPLPRWQFILGKWMGVSVLNLVLLGAAAVVIYGMVYYIRWVTPPSDERYDKARLENEVLVARHAVTPRLPDFARMADDEYEQRLERGEYADRIDLNPALERGHLSMKHEAAFRAVAPLDGREFEFTNVLCDRSPDNRVYLRYKTRVTNYPPDEVFRSLWVFGDPRKGAKAYRVPTRHVVGRFHSIEVPADCVAPDGTLTVQFLNRNPWADLGQERQWGNVIEFFAKDEVEVLFVVGSFEGNFLRLLCLMACKLMYLAALGLLMTSLFSFPVACLVSFTVYVLAGTRRFIWDALEYTARHAENMFSSVSNFLAGSAMYLYQGVTVVVPDFGRYDAVESFVNGRNVTLVWVLQGVFGLVLIQTTLILGLAMLFFQRREVAEVSI